MAVAVDADILKPDEIVAHAGLLQEVRVAVRGRAPGTTLPPTMSRTGIDLKLTSLRAGSFCIQQRDEAGPVRLLLLDDVEARGRSRRFEASAACA